MVDSTRPIGGLLALEALPTSWERSSAAVEAGAFEALRAAELPATALWNYVDPLYGKGCSASVVTCSV